jgi:hypothetical protein
MANCGPIAALLALALLAGAGGAAAAPGEGPCFADPTAPACADFEMPAADADTLLVAACAAMPEMVGCSLRAACAATGGGAPACAPFVLYATMCEEMEMMSDCGAYVALCKAGSAVRSCTAPGPLRAAPTTDAATRAVVDTCADHSMPGCEKCTSRASCPRPLEALGAICADMPGMQACSPLWALCDEAGGAALGEICAPATESNPSPMPAPASSAARAVGAAALLAAALLV